MSLEPDRLCIFIVDAATLSELGAEFEGEQVTFTLYTKSGKAVGKVVGGVAPAEKADPDEPVH